MKPDPVSEISRMRTGKIYPGLRAKVFRVLQEIFSRTGRTMNVAQGFRSFDDQLVIYSMGRELRGDTWAIINPHKIVTNSKPGLSWHCYGLAWDASWAGADPYLEKEPNLAPDLWKAFGECGKAHGFRWGGDSIRLLNGVFDTPHLDMCFGLSIDQALELFQHGGLQAVWAYIDQVRGVEIGQDWESAKGLH